MPAWAGEYDSLLTVQQQRAGERERYFFPIPLNFGIGILESGASPVYKSDSTTMHRDLEFLISYLPLGDLGTMTAMQLSDNAFLAEEARNRFPWGKTYGDDLFLHFVLPHRISQEPYREWRMGFISALMRRVQNLSMSDAALEVNHWCREQATYRPTDARDQDPLTTIKAGFGRCEEEMILAIAALRSVGIPARQCYTPYWAHCDDNHAWVEVWVDGEWHYFGACEPEPALNQAWFTNAASRAMLVVSSVYGDYDGDEPVLRRYGRSTLINSTAVYGPTKELRVTLLNPKGKPLANQRVIFNLFNYGALMPALALKTDSLGVCSLVSGIGDWFITARSEKSFALARVPAEQTDIQLSMVKFSKLTDRLDFEYTPPGTISTQGGAVSSPESEARGLSPQASNQPIVPMDSLFRCRLQGADSSREAAIDRTIARSYEILVSPDIQVGRDEWAPKPDYYLADTARIRALLEKARGNAVSAMQFLGLSEAIHDTFRSSRMNDNRVRTAADYRFRLLVLESLADKDLRDQYNLVDLNRFLMNTQGADAFHYNAFMDSLNCLDSTSLARYKDYVLCPRIDYEPTFDWRQCSLLFKEQPVLKTSQNDETLIRWLRDSIAVETDPDRLGPPLTPDQCLTLRRGTQRDVERLYIALCRVRNIPARRNPVTDRVDRWDDRLNDWREVAITADNKAAKGAQKGQNGSLTIRVAEGDTIAAGALYLRDWSVCQWAADHLEPVEFGWHQQASQISWPQALPAGLYCLVSGIRCADGSAPLKLHWFRLHDRGVVDLQLQFQQ